jgi:hypothetical protein
MRENVNSATVRGRFPYVFGAMSSRSAGQEEFWADVEVQPDVKDNGDVPGHEALQKMVQI